MKKPLVSILLMVKFWAAQAQPTDFPPNAEPGKCYQSCLSIQNGGKYESTYAVFIGRDTTGVSLRMVKLPTGSTVSKWEKKGSSKHCHSENPDDCLVWCLVDSPVIDTIWVVADTLQTKDFVLKKVFFEEKKAKKGKPKWQEVVCEKDRTEGFLLRVADALERNGFKIGPSPERKKYGARYREALTQFQKENQLPVGGFDFETLDFLGIEH